MNIEILRGFSSIAADLVEMANIDNAMSLVGGEGYKTELVFRVVPRKKIYSGVLATPISTPIYFCAIPRVVWKKNVM